MITLCPHCVTRFRVTPEQLSARQGLVRCGQCSTVFNGFEHLARADDALAAGSATRTQAIAATKEAATNESGQANSPLIADRLTGHVEVPAPPPVWSPAPDSMATPADAEAATGRKTAPAAFHLLRGYIHADPPVPVWTPATDVVNNAVANVDVANNGAANTGIATTSAIAEEFVSDDALAAFSASLESPETEASETMVAPEEALDELLAEPAALVAEPTANATLYRPEIGHWPKPKRAGLMAATVLLVTALSMQATFLFRTEIAANWPETKSYLAEACGLVGCKVPLPRQIDTLSIEASELQADPVRASVVHVTAILRNRSATIQAYPTLEITFTDTLDRPVARRSLEAADYTPQKLASDEGIAAAGEAIAKATIETVDLKPSGYRLRLYYR